MDSSACRNFNIWFWRKYFFGFCALIPWPFIYWWTSDSVGLFPCIAYSFLGVVSVILAFVAEYVWHSLHDRKSLAESIFSRCRPEVGDILNMVRNGLAEHSHSCPGTGYEDAFILRGNANKKPNKIFVMKDTITVFKAGKEVKFYLTNKEKYIVDRCFLAVEKEEKKKEIQAAISAITEVGLEVLAVKEEETLNRIKELKSNMTSEESEIFGEKACQRKTSMLTS